MTTFGFRYVDGPVDVREYPEGSGTQTFKTGDPVELAAGAVVVASDDQGIWGIAMQDASGTATTKIRVAIINPSQIWCAIADAQTLQAQEGLKYGLNLSAGNCTIDIGDTTTVTVVVQQLDPADGPATSLGKMWVRFLPAVCLSIVGE